MRLREIFTQKDYHEWVRKDPHLQDLMDAPFQWEWPCLNEIVDKMGETFSPASQRHRGGIQILRGPRQVGKTTLIKVVISKLWQMFSLKPPESILVQGDWIEDFNALDQLLRPYLTLDSPPDLIVIDEITFVRDWQRALKGWYDEGLGRKTQFLLTGSNAFDLKKQAELLPGRRGKGKDFELLPMSYLEFVKSCANRLSGNSDYDIFQIYLSTGGFPHAVREYLETGNTDEAQDTYLRWIRGDFLKAGRSDSLLRELFLALLKMPLIPVGSDDLRERSSMGSHNTVRDYLDYAEAGFILFELARIDANKWNFFPRKNKKYYFRDPMIAKIALQWSGAVLVQEQFKALLCESIVAEYLRRKGLRFGYYHDAKKNEIDFVSKEFAIEVKSAIKTESHSLLSSLKHSNKIQLYLGKEHKEWKNENGRTRLIPIWDFLTKPSFK